THTAPLFPYSFPTRRSSDLPSVPSWCVTPVLQAVRSHSADPTRTASRLPCKHARIAALRPSFQPRRYARASDALKPCTNITRRSRFSCCCSEWNRAVFRHAREQNLRRFASLGRIHRTPPHCRQVNRSRLIGLL